MSEVRWCGVASVIWLLAAISAAFAQVPTTEEPGRQGQRFEQPRAVDVRAGGIISLPSTIAPEAAAQISLLLSSVRFSGGSVYAQAELETLASDLIGTRISLAEIYALAQKVTAKYGADGYVLSRAIVPPQEIDPARARVTIQIVEAYVDEVVWPDLISRYQDFFSDYSTKITAERPANINTIMRYLLLAGDSPGLDVTSRFQASDTNPNASTLIVEVTEKPVDVYARVDNRGTDARGPVQYLASATINNVLGAHEALRLTYGGVTDFRELQHFAVNARKVLNSEGLTAFVDVSGSLGEPGTAALQALAYKSNSIAVSGGLSFPIIRSRDQNLTAKGIVFASNSNGELLATPSSQDMLRGVRFGFDYNLADSLNGINQASVLVSQGILGLGSSTNANLLASRANGRVDFTKIEASLSREQQFGGGFSLFSSAEGQLAVTPMLSPEECSFGGPNTGRGFDSSELSGDSCISVLGELRFDPDIPNNPLEITQLYAFVDIGHVFRIAPSAGTASTATGASAGAGLRLGNDNFNLDLQAVKPLTGRTNQDWRFFAVLGASY